MVVEAQTERALIIPPGIGIPFEFRYAAQFSRGKPVFLWTINEPEAMFGVNIDEIAIDGDSFVVNITNDNPALESLNFISSPKDSTSVLLIDMDVPAAGIFRVFWSVKEGFCENDSIKAPLEKGRNVLFLPSPVPTGEDFRLRIDPGTVTGKYRIRKIEMRATLLGQR